MLSSIAEESSIREMDMMSLSVGTDYGQHENKSRKHHDSGNL
jgi:hypothetical protein